MVLIDPASAGFQFALLINFVVMILATVLGYMWSPRILNVIVAEAIVAILLYITFPSIVVAFG